jgi:hypothetical protein
MVSESSANMRKNDYSKHASRSDRKKSSNNQNQPKTNCILHFKDPKPSDKPIKAIIFELDDTEVSQIRSFKTGDNDANLVGLMSQIVNLGDLYEMWGNRKSRKLAQMMSWALDGQVRDDWLEIINEQDNWDGDNMKEQFIRLLQNLGMKTFGPKAYKQQCKVMENGSIKISENNLWAGTHRLFQINWLIIYLSIYAHKYSIKEMNKIIVKSLSPKAMCKYVGEGGDDLVDKSDIFGTDVANWYQAEIEVGSCGIRAKSKSQIKSFESTIK